MVLTVLCDNTNLHYQLAMCILSPLQSSFYGVFEPRMSSLSLAKVLTHTLTTNDQRLARISVRSEEVCPPGVTGVITRSRKSQMPVEWNEVPLVVKIFKLLVGDVANELEIEQPESADGSDVCVCVCVCVCVIVCVCNYV